MCWDCENQCCDLARSPSEDITYTCPCTCRHLCIIVKEKYTAFIESKCSLNDKVLFSLFPVEFDKLTRKMPLIFFFTHKPPPLLEELFVCVSVCLGGLVLDSSLIGVGGL